MKCRCFPDKNYKSFFFNGKTIRIALDPKKEISELDYPEFYDVKITNKCDGKCPYCYMDSKPNKNHVEDLVEKIKSFFGKFDDNQKPFQVAYGGGEPTEHPDFEECLRASHELDIVPNYTTNGMFIRYGEDKVRSIIEATEKYSQGVAISCHPHLVEYWTKAAKLFVDKKVKLNFHIIISDKESCDDFRKIYNTWHKDVDYFVLLPYSDQGRGDAKENELDWDYLCSIMPDNVQQVAFGANFYPFLCKDRNKFKVSLYEPESMSKYLDMTNMKLYNSSFSVEEEEK